MNNEDHRRSPIRPLPRGANGMERRLAKALSERIALARDALAQDGFTEDQYERYEATMLDAAEKLGRLRQSVDNRLSGGAQ